MSQDDVIRPQRRLGSQRYQPLHSAGLLVEVVRTLTTSPSQAQKELVKERLEKDYLATKEAVDNLVDDQHNDVASALQSFRRVSGDVQTARERIQMIKNNLASCQLLLRCKRDELKKLWLESAELKHVSRLLDQLNTLKTSQHQIAKYVEDGLYVHAAESLNASNCLLDGPVKDIDGLREVRATHAQLKADLYKVVMKEIYKLLYVKPSNEVLRDPRRVSSTLQQEDNDASRAEPVASGGTDYASLLDDVPAVGKNGCALEEFQEDHPVQRLAILSDALGLLGCIEQASKKLLDDIEDHLWRVVVYRTTRFICEHLHGSSGVSGEALSLAELLRLLFVQLRFITSVFAVLINQLKRTLELRKQNIHDGFNMENVWDRVQSTLQRLLAMYLDVNAERADGDKKSVGIADVAHVSVYFSKKPIALPSRRLFSFENTAFSQAYDGDDRESTAIDLEADEQGEVVCVCKPGPKNIKAAFRLVIRFIAEVEGRLTKSPCRLRLFLNSYVKKSFLPTLRQDLVQKARSFLSERSDAWTRTTSSASAEDQATVLNLRLDLPNSAVPLLFSTLKMLDCCRDVEMVLSTAPSFCREFFQLWLQILKLYLDSASVQYVNLTCATPSSELCSPRPGGRAAACQERRRKISAAWAMDTDISRLLKSLPNWLSLSLAPETPAGTPSAIVDSPQGVLSGSSCSPHMENADGVRSRNVRESEILISNLGNQTHIDESELILSDSRRLQLLACFQESVEYFWCSSKSTLTNLPAQVRQKLKVNAAFNNVSEEEEIGADAGNACLVNGRLDCASPMDEFLDNLASIEHLSSTCLLMLHLEVRVHCFHHLLPLIRQPMFIGSSEEVDEQVPRLNKDLIQLNNLLSGSLQAQKLRYIFEGLGHLISTIFIAGCQHILRISDIGKKRICRDIFAVQQCLSTLTGSRETDLDHARRFYELLYKSPDEILNTIVESGAEYSIADYTNLLSLAIRSHPVLSSEPGALDTRLQRLKNVLAEKCSCD